MQSSECNQVNATMWMQTIECEHLKGMHLSEWNQVNATKLMQPS